MGDNGATGVVGGGRGDLAEDFVDDTGDKTGERWDATSFKKLTVSSKILFFSGFWAD